VVIPQPEPVVVAETSPVAAAEMVPSDETKEQLRSILNELTEPNLPKRPKRGPKKRGGGGIPAILRDFAAPPGQVDKGAAPHSSTEEPQAPQPPFDDSKP
jgi:hypothetical protein